MIFQHSDWVSKPMIWVIIVKFDQIRKNWWRISDEKLMAEILEVGKNSVTSHVSPTPRNPWQTNVYLQRQYKQARLKLKKMKGYSK